MDKIVYITIAVLIAFAIPQIPYIEMYAHCGEPCQEQKERQERQAAELAKPKMTRLINLACKTGDYEFYQVSRNVEC